MAKDKNDEATEPNDDGLEAVAVPVEGGGSKKKKMIIIIAGVVVLLVAVGVGLMFSGVLGGKSGGEEHAQGVELGEDGKPLNTPIFYTMPEFLVNLNSSSKQTSFLKTTIILELPKLTDTVVVEANLPRLVDAMNTYLRELRASDLAGSAGIQRLREELLLRANKTLAPLKINDVLFKEIVVQ